MKKITLLLIFMTLGTLALFSQVKIVLEKDIKLRKTDSIEISRELAKNALLTDSVSSSTLAKNETLKSAEELEAIINELSYKNREKVIMRNINRKSSARKPRRS